MKRNHEIKIRLSRNELDSLTKKVRKTPYSREGYCRRALFDSQIKAVPPADVPYLIQELRKSNALLDKLLKAIQNGAIFPEDELREMLSEGRKAENLIYQTYTIGGTN